MAGSPGGWRLARGAGRGSPGPHWRRRPGRFAGAPSGEQPGSLGVLGDPLPGPQAWPGAGLRPAASRALPSRASPAGARLTLVHGAEAELLAVALAGLLPEGLSVVLRRPREIRLALRHVGQRLGLLPGLRAACEEAEGGGVARAAACAARPASPPRPTPLGAPPPRVSTAWRRGSSPRPPGSRGDGDELWSPKGGGQSPGPESRRLRPDPAVPAAGPPWPLSLAVSFHRGRRALAFSHLPQKGENPG